MDEYFPQQLPGVPGVRAPVPTNHDAALLRNHEVPLVEPHVYHVVADKDIRRRVEHNTNTNAHLGLYIKI